MSFVEFLEFVARIGELRFREVQQTLSWKIESILEVLIPAFGLKKNEVNLDLEENSQSDDDY
jgi:hypothetical protein